MPPAPRTPGAAQGADVTTNSGGGTAPISLLRRVARRLRRTVARLRRTTVREPVTCRLTGQRLRLVLPDASGLVTLAAHGGLTGHVQALDLDLTTAPQWQLTALRPPRPGRSTVSFRWQRRGHGLRVRLRWSAPYDVGRALADAQASVLRSRSWDQLSGPVRERPPAPLVVTALANPYGRRLVGAATCYRLGWHGERAVLHDPTGRVVSHADEESGAAALTVRGGVDKYAVVTLDAPVPGHRFATGAMRALAASGIVFAAPDPAVRAGLDTLGLVNVPDAAAVSDLAGYALSVRAARSALIHGDATLRRTALAGDGTLPLPAVSAVISTMRAAHLPQLLAYLADQSYPALEAVVGLHGYDLPAAERERLADSLPFPVRFVTYPTELPFGQVLGQLSRLADGELLTKLDDDDHYGVDHVTDLVLAWHTSGADLVAKGARFVHFPERDQTIDRAWAAPEIFDVTPAGGTMLFSRGTLAQVGGWSHSVRHVDSELLDRVRSVGGLTYRTHAMEYVYVRRSSGHTFVTETEELLAHGERTYPGLPPEIIHPGAGALPAAADPAAR